MKKCISCESEIFPQARFCGQCGVLQPLEKGIDEIGNDQTVGNSTSTTDNTQLDTPLIPPPPAPPKQGEEEKEDENKSLELPLPQFSENKPDDTGSIGQLESQGHGHHLQSQPLHDEHLQSQPLHGEHLQSQPLHGEHLQSQPLYGSHQQPYEFYGPHQQSQPLYGSHQQPHEFYGSHQQSQPLYGSHEQPYHNYQQSPNSMSQTTTTAAKVGTTVTKTGTTIAAKWIIIIVIAAIALGGSGVGVVLAFHPFHLFTSPLGPNGSPSDDASFTIQLTVQGTTYTNDPFFPNTYTLTITGGTVCASRDNGTPVSGQGPAVNDNTVTYNETSTYSCSGTYKGGTVSYSETLKTETLNFSDGINCTLNSPQPILQITGSYTTQHNFSGKAGEFSIDSSMFACTPAGSSASNVGDTGTWTGTVSQS